MSTEELAGSAVQISQILHIFKFLTKAHSMLFSMEYI